METVFDGVKCITTSTGGANDRNNLYIVEGDDYAAVIDPGYEAASAANIEDQIEQSHENKPIKYILLTLTIIFPFKSTGRLSSTFFGCLFWINFSILNSSIYYLKKKYLKDL